MAAVVDLDAELARASANMQPIVILVTEGQSGSGNDETSLLIAATARSSIPVARLILDINNSRNRATATRFHVPNPPVLLCLSPRGLIVSRDETPITEDLIFTRIKEVVEKAPQLDADLALLEASTQDPRHVMARLKLADFLFAKHNAREAIPHLAFVAHAEAADTAVRIRAWVDLVRAHYWISEPEKGRHEAKDLIATLSPKSPEARAGGMLVLGLQDLNGKRFALARQEFEEAIAAAPDSPYAKEAAEAVAKLRLEGK